MSNRAFILLPLFCFLKAVTAQQSVEPDKMKAFNITVNYEDYTVKTQMLKDPKKLDAEPGLTYYWYASNKIIETKGGFDGKLLDGYYKVFYLNNQLREQGQFKYGLKNSEWKNWYPDGKLKEVINWKSGRKKGEYCLYNEYGLLMAKGKFKNDLLTGKFETYDNRGNVTSIKNYKNGVEIIPEIKEIKKQESTTGEEGKEKKKFGWRFKSIFKRKDKKKAEDPQKTESATKTTTS